MADIATTTVTVGQAIELVRLGIQARGKLFLWGPPGVGKSAAVYQAAALEGIAAEHVFEARASQIDAVTARGLPVADPASGICRWTRPEFLPPADLHEPSLLFLDELPQAVQTVQSAFYEAVHNHRIGPHVIPAECVVLAAGNRAGVDRSGAFAISAALANRFDSHLEVRADVDDWAAWATSAGVDASIVAFVRWRGLETLCEAPGTGVAGRSFATPRSWHNLSNLLGHAEAAITGRKDATVLLAAVVEGAVGPGCGAAYLGYRKVYAELPDLDAWLAGQPVTLPTADELRDRPDIAYAICGAIASRYRAATAAKVAAGGIGRPAISGRALEAVAPTCKACSSTGMIGAVPCATCRPALPPEFAVLLVADLGRIDGPPVYGTPRFTAEYLRRYREVML